MLAGVHRFKRPELEITFSLTALRLGLFCSYILVTLLALLIFLFLAIIGNLWMMGLKTSSFSKTKTLLRINLTSSTGSYGAVRDISPPELNRSLPDISLLKFFFILHWLKKC
jgi:hypothetical protein